MRGDVMTGTLSCAHFTRMAVDPHTIQNGRALRTDGRRASGCPLKVGNPQTAGEQGARGGDGRIREPGLSQKRENVVVCILGEPQLSLVAYDPVDRRNIIHRVMTLDEINLAVRTKLRKEKLQPVSEQTVGSRTDYLRGNPKDDMTPEEMDRLRFGEARYVRSSATKSDEGR